MVKYNYPEHFCKSAAGAIKLAEKLKASGKYDLFRGQRHTFDISPSIFRRDVDHEEANRRLDEFAGWIHRTPDLKSLHEDDDAIIAVAQHYGMKTPFLDFTYSPEVAGFFATNGGLDGDVGTIVCINRQRFIESWADINDRHVSSNGFPLASVVEIDVKNLWRIQAQSGLFIRCHVDPTMLEMFSFMLHIYFPQKAGVTILEASRIYPQEKSHLEVMLDHYFLIETYGERKRRLREIFGTEISVNEDTATKEVVSYFRSGRAPDPHWSWKSDFAKAWYAEPDERLSSATRTRSAELVMPDCTTPREFEKSVQANIQHSISLSQLPLRDHIEWSVLFEDRSIVYIDGEGEIARCKDEWTLFSMGEMINRIYAGMRYLPYTDVQISRAITRYVNMVRFGCYEVIEETEGVEFSGGEIRGRGFCNRSSLLAAIREDFYSLIKPEKLNAQGGMDFRDTFYVARFVRSSYVFEKFVELFVEDLIPSQAAVAVEGLTIGLNPMRIDVFGES